MYKRQVHILGTDYAIVLGPAFSVPVTSEIIRTYMHENAIALEYQEAVAEFLCTIPRITYQQFSRHLALIHLCLNQKEISVQDLFQQDNEHVRKREEQNVNEIANNIENNNLHDSYSVSYTHLKKTGSFSIFEIQMSVSCLHKSVFSGRCV